MSYTTNTHLPSSPNHTNLPNYLLEHAGLKRLERQRLDLFKKILDNLKKTKETPHISQKIQSTHVQRETMRQRFQTRFC